MKVFNLDIPSRFVPLCILYTLQASYLGNWAASLPVIEKNRGISDGLLGDYLTIAVIGAIFSMIVGERLLKRFGSRVVNIASMLLKSISFTTIAINGSDALFGFGIFLFGVTMILSNTSLLSQGVLLEKDNQQLWLGTLQAFYGLGGGLGALVSGGLLDSGISLVAEVAIFTFIVWLILFINFFWLYSAEEERYIQNKAIESPPRDSDIQKMELSGVLSQSYKQHTEEEKTASPLHSDLLPIALIDDPASSQKDVLLPKDFQTFFALISLAGITYLAESAVSNWSAIYLERHWNCGAIVGTLGFAAQLVCLIISCLACDQLVNRGIILRRKLANILVVVSIVGLLVLIIANYLPVNNGSLALVIFGFGFMGLGLGPLIPLWGSIAGRGITGFSKVQTVSFAVAAANILWVLSPLLIGNVSNALSALALSFAVVLVLVMFLFIALYNIPEIYFLKYGE